MDVTPFVFLYFVIGYFVALICHKFDDDCNDTSIKFLVMLIWPIFVALLLGFASIKVFQFVGWLLFTFPEEVYGLVKGIVEQRKSKSDNNDKKVGW